MCAGKVGLGDEVAVGVVAIRLVGRGAVPRIVHAGQEVIGVEGIISVHLGACIPGVMRHLCPVAVLVIIVFDIIIRDTGDGVVYLGQSAALVIGVGCYFTVGVGDGCLLPAIIVAVLGGVGQSVNIGLDCEHTAGLVVIIVGGGSQGGVLICLGNLGLASGVVIDIYSCFLKPGRCSVHDGLYQAAVFVVVPCL